MFTYWGGIRSGKMQIWQLFELNGKTTAISTISGKKWPAFFILYSGGERSHIIYEQDNHIKTKFHKPACIVDGKYDLKSDWGKDGIERESGWSTDPQVLYKSFDRVFEQDLIVNPFLLFGYYGKVGTEEFNEMVEKRQPNMKVDLDYTISELKKRRNIIPYKTDKVHEKYLFNMLTLKKDFIEGVLKSSQQLTPLIEGLLTEYEIPYEKFDLDAALLNNDYSTFGLDKPLPKNILEEDMNAAQNSNRSLMKPGEPFGSAT